MSFLVQALKLLLRTFVFEFYSEILCVKCNLTKFCALLGHCGKYESPKVNNRFESFKVTMIECKQDFDLVCKVE